jgi:hypothetical protein
MLVNYLRAARAMGRSRVAPRGVYDLNWLLGYEFRSSRKRASDRRRESQWSVGYGGFGPGPCLLLLHKPLLARRPGPDGGIR